ncbi:hypothetical protein ACIPIC_02660 [Streptomyces collinus]|uniref:hypothetical protein n=1 Tax=Streptomyces collinus TaxID=42684 RepID=UPI00345511B2
MSRKSDKELARRAVSIELASGNASTAEQLLRKEFTPSEMRRAVKYLESGKDVTGR